MPSADVLGDPTVGLALGAFGSLDGSGPWKTSVKPLVASCLETHGGARDVAAVVPQ